MVNKESRGANQDLQELQHAIERLRLEVMEYKRREILWQQCSQRIAYNIRQKGLQMHQIDYQFTVGSCVLPQTEVAKILRPFEEEMPASGRV